MKMICILILGLLMMTPNLSKGDETKNIGKNVAGAINESMKDAMKFAKYCRENPEDPKCVARKKQKQADKKEELKGHIDMYKEASKDPELKKVMDREMEKDEARKNKILDGAMEQGDRKQYLDNIKEMCEDPKSAACEAAKEDYKEFKSAKRKSANQ